MCDSVPTGVNKGFTLAMRPGWLNLSRINQDLFSKKGTK
jgi:hypothetical protein